MNAMLKAFQLRDEGMARAIDNAQDGCFDWPDRAYAFLVAYAKTHRHFSAFHVTEAAIESTTFPAAKGQAWGGIYRKALADGLIAEDGYDKHPKRHASRCIRYLSQVFAGGAA